jgi:hypothetical protein
VRSGREQLPAGVARMAGFQLTTLGRTELTGADGGSILSVLAQPKRFALLVYLSVEASDGFVRRDAVAALFWPESDQADARANLRKSIYYLRQALGQAVVRTRGDEEVGIDSSRLHCDTVTLFTGGDVDTRGEFLEGFHFAGASVEWEDWLTTVRRRVLAFAPHEETRDRFPGDATVPEVGAASDVLATSDDSMKRSLIFPLALAALTIAGLGWALVQRGEVEPTRFDLVRLGSGAQFPTVVQRHYALPPDGSGILFRDSVGRRQGTWWKPLNELEPRYVEGLDEVFSPSFSPDGQWVAFSREGALWKQLLASGPSVLLLDSISDDFNPGIAWVPGRGILYEDPDHGLRLLREEDGTTELLATAEQVGEVFQARTLPTGEGVVVTGCDGWCEAANPRLSYVDLEQGAIIPLRSGVWMAWPMTDGYLVMVDERGSVFASSFDPSVGVLGPPIPLLDGVRTSPFPDITIGTDGSLLYIPGEVDPYGERLVWVDRDGRRTPVDPSWPGTSRVRSLSLSPDGRRLALGMWTDADSSGEQLWIKELPTGPLSPLTAGPGQARRPVWSGDGGTLAFIRQTRGPDSTWQGWVSTLPADASSLTPEPLLRHEGMIMEVTMTEDWGTAVVRAGDAGKGDGDIAFTYLPSPREWMSLLNSRANEYGVTLSPDGRWLAYVSEANGHPEVYVRPFPGPGPRVQVSEAGAVEPRWAHSGEELFFRALRPDAPDGHTAFMVAASVTAEPTFRVNSRRTLFGTAGYVRGPRVPLYEVSEDDRRFLMVARLGPRDWSQGEAAYSRGWYWSQEVQAKLGR